MPPAKDYNACRAMLCGLCINQQGYKALRHVLKHEEQELKELIPGYDRSRPYFPSGICKCCIFLMKGRRSGSNVELLLPENYHVDLPRVTR